MSWWKFWEKKAQRADGWANAMTGLGDLNRDKSTMSSFEAEDLNIEEAEQLWSFDDLAAKIVEKFPAEMFREGYEFCIPGEKDLSEEVQAFAEDLGVDEAFQHALEIERALGGAAIFPVINDGGGDLTMPLREEAISEITSLVLFDPRELQARTYYDDLKHPKFGLPQTFSVWPANPGGYTDTLPEIHESRFILFPGIQTTRRAAALRQYRGWGISVLARCHRVLREYNISWAAATALLHDFSQAVLKVEGLAEMISSQGTDKLRDRLVSLDMQRSVIRTMILDSEESFERSPTQMTGLPDLLDRFKARLAATADIPISVLFGDPPTGLAATGKADRATFADTIKGSQNKHLLPRLKHMYKLMLVAKTGPTGGKEPANYALNFRPSEQMTDDQVATIRNKQADTDTKYIATGVVSPDEVRKSRFGGDKYSLETVVSGPAPPAPTNLSGVSVSSDTSGGSSIDPTRKYPDSGPTTK